MNFIFDQEQAVRIPTEKIFLDGLLYIPQQARGMIIFVHGSGSSRLSPRNQFVAKILQEAQFATLLFDLLTQEEDAIDNQTREYRFNIKLLSERLIIATHWVLAQPLFKKFSIGYFGASTGGAAALLAVTQAPKNIKAVVSRGGRPDLAGDALALVKAATLLIVGGDDEIVIQLNQQALKQLNCIKELSIIPGATHLFEEPGKLVEVAKLASHWFKENL